MTEELKNILFQRIWECITADNCGDYERLKAAFVCSMTNDEDFDTMYYKEKNEEMAIAIANGYRCVYYAGIHNLVTEPPLGIMTAYKNRGGTLKMIFDNLKDDWCLSGVGSGNRERGFLEERIEEDWYSIATDAEKERLASTLKTFNEELHKDKPNV